jgi:hypothetical protein
VKTLTKFALCLVGTCGLIFSASAQDVVNTVIGGGPTGLPGVNANMYQPYQEAIDASGNIYVASTPLQKVFKISTTGVETIIAGTGTAGYNGDGGPAAQAELYNPEGVAVDSASPANVYIADFSNCLVRKVSQTTGIITTVAGLVSSGRASQCGYNGDGSAANAAELYGPAGVGINPTTNDMYIADYYNGIVRKVAGGGPTGTITTYAGTPQQNCQGSAPYGDGGAADEAHLCYPSNVTVDTSTKPINLFISETSSVCAVREVVGSSSDIYQVAGSYSACGYNGDGINAVGAELYNPWQTHVSVSGSTTTVEIADYNNARVRQFTLTYSGGVPKPGNISTIAGKGQGGWCNDDGGSALSACMNPVGIVYDASGNFYLADYGADRVRKVTKSTGFIQTIDGWGPNGQTEVWYSDPVGVSGVAGGNPSLYYPQGVYADPTSTKVYVAGYSGQAVYEWDSAAKTISGFAGNGVYGFAGDGSPASSAATELAYPVGVAKDSKGNVYIADSGNCAIREVTTNGDITTFAGGSPGALKGCGYINSNASNSQFSNPQAVAVDSANNVYVADYGNCAIRKIPANGSLTETIAGVGPPTGSCGTTGDGGPAADAKIYYPISIALDAAGNIYFSEWNSACRIREIVAQSGIIQTVAGAGACGNTGDGPAIGNAIFDTFSTVDPNGNLFMTDYQYDIVRWVTPSGQMLTFAGTTGTNGFTGDGGPALSATFDGPEGIARDSSGNTYVADYQNWRIRQITPFAAYGLSTGGLLFETQPAGTVSDFQPVTVSAIGPITFSGITVSAGFNEIDDCVGESLTANQTCEIDVYFQPSTAGKVDGTLTISSNATTLLGGEKVPNTVSLIGTASGLTLTGTEAFGAVPLKNPAAQTLTLTNSGAAVTLSKIYLTLTTAFSITGGTCPVSGGPLASKASCTIIVTFNPQTVGGFKSTLVVASNDPASPLLAQVTGTGTEVKLSASSIAFGSISFGKTSTFNLTISNAGTASFTLAETVSGAGFSISSTGKTCSTSLAAGASCVLPVEYDPTAVGTNSGTLTLTTNGGSSPVIPLSGTCTTDVSVSPTTLPFGTVADGTAKVLDVTVSNVGTISSLTVSASISGTGSAAFKVLTTGNTCTTGVAAGKSCTLPVQFEDATTGSYSGTLTVTTNGGQNPTVSLSGTTN